MDVLGYHIRYPGYPTLILMDICVLFKAAWLTTLNIFKRFSGVPTPDSVGSILFSSPKTMTLSQMLRGARNLEMIMAKNCRSSETITTEDKAMVLNDPVVLVRTLVWTRVKTTTSVPSMIRTCFCSPLPFVVLLRTAQ